MMAVKLYKKRIFLVVVVIIFCSIITIFFIDYISPPPVTSNEYENYISPPPVTSNEYETLNKENIHTINNSSLIVTTKITSSNSKISKAFLKVLDQKKKVTEELFEIDDPSVRIKNKKKTRSFNVNYDDDTFVKDGELVQIIAGSIHYFRIPRIYWKDRLNKVKAAGLNAIQVYVPWNYHEFFEDIYDFKGEKDLVHFLKLAHQLDLMVLLRVGPYICAEWDLGGLPAWLLKKNPFMQLRTSAPEFINEVHDWFSVLLPLIKPQLYSLNGSIIMIQIENEYGTYFSCDKTYLELLYFIIVNSLRAHVVYYTTDTMNLKDVNCGSIPTYALVTIDFGTSIKELEYAFLNRNKVQNKGPLMNSEYYTGWFDQWGSVSIKPTDNEFLHHFTKLLNYRNIIHFSFYMFHGGTNFGFWSSKNSITSYDYNAPISEAGDITKKYMGIRKAILKKYPKLKLPDVPLNVAKIAYGKVILQRNVNFLRHFLLNSQIKHNFPATMESIGHYQGYIFYVTDISSYQEKNLILKIEAYNDFGIVFTSNGNFSNIKFEDMLSKTNGIPNPVTIRKNSKLIILIENAGHYNFLDRILNDVKGINGSVTINNYILTNWIHNHLDFVNISSFKTSKDFNNSKIPLEASLYEGSFNINSASEVADTFISLPNFVKGVIIINGHNVGRYWNKMGPQYSFYVPSSFLNIGINNIVVFELEGGKCLNTCIVEFGTKFKFN